MTARAISSLSMRSSGEGWRAMESRRSIPPSTSVQTAGTRWSTTRRGLVIGVEVNGKHRAYPMQILIWHEIVNETFDGKHLLVTY